MKKTIFASVAVLALSTVAGASTISCVINQSTTPNGATSASTTVFCPGVSAVDVGSNQITAITLRVKGSFDDSAISPAYHGQLSFAFTEDSGQFNVPTLSGNAPNGGPADVGSTGVLSGIDSGLALSSLTNFNVEVLETLLSGGRLPTNSNVTVSYEYALTPLTPPSSVPEPSTYVMIGLGLSGFALRRRA